MPTSCRQPTRTLLQWTRRCRSGLTLGVILLVGAFLLTACDGYPAASLQLSRLDSPAKETADAPADPLEPIVDATATPLPLPSLTPFQPISLIALGPDDPSTATSTPAATDTRPRPTRTLPAPTVTLAAPTSTLPGYAAADFDLAALNASGLEKISLGSLKGKPVVLTFFATWCANCRREIPLLSSVYAEYKDRIHIISIDLGESAPKVKSFIQTMRIPYPVLLDQSRATVRSYQIRGIPTTYFLDANGRIIDRYLGELTQKTLQQRLNKLIGQ